MKNENSDFLVNIVNDALPFTEATEAKILIALALIVLVISAIIWWFRRR